VFLRCCGDGCMQQDACWCLSRPRHAPTDTAHMPCLVTGGAAGTHL
jgi:hypothetical protein